MALLGGLLVWGIFAPSPLSWLVFGIGAAFVIAGAGAQYLITGRRLKERQIPSRSVIVGLVAGVIGLFAIPSWGCRSASRWVCWPWSICGSVISARR